jgi:hypothetical protein
MARRIFISYQHRDHGKAQGFNLLRWNRNVALEVSARHLLSPVDSHDPDYISRRIREQIHGTSVTVVLLGRNTIESDWVRKEIEWSLQKDTPNGILAIRIDADARVPDPITECGAEVIDWLQPSDTGAFEDAIERAALAAQRAPAIVSAAQSGAGGDSCGR